MNAQKPRFDNRLDTQAGLKDYQTVADAVGMVPSLRVKDNVIQAVVVVLGFLIGAGVGAAFASTMKVDWYVAAGIGGVGGLIVSTLISGGVIMVLGWVRAANKIK